MKKLVYKIVVKLIILVLLVYLLMYSSGEDIPYIYAGF